MIRLSQARLSSTVRPLRGKFIISNATAGRDDGCNRGNAEDLFVGILHDLRGFSHTVCGRCRQTGINCPGGGQNAAYSPTDVGVRVFPLRETDACDSNDYLPRCVLKAREATDRIGCAASLAAETQKKDAHQTWRPSVAAFGLRIVFAI